MTPGGAPLRTNSMRWRLEVTASENRSWSAKNGMFSDTTLSATPDSFLFSSGPAGRADAATRRGATDQGRAVRAAREGFAGVILMGWRGAPAEKAPSLEVFTNSSTPFLSPSALVGYHFSSTCPCEAPQSGRRLRGGCPPRARCPFRALSANANGSLSTWSFRSVMTTTRYPVSASMLLAS